MQITQIIGEEQHMVTGYAPDHVAVNVCGTRQA
jgi:hypothetical protein